MDLIQLAGSLIAILVLALLAWKLFPNNSKIDKDRAARNIKRYCPDIGDSDISNAHFFISTCGQTAFVSLPKQCGIVILRQTGDRIAVRHFGTEINMHVSEKNDGVRININDFTMPAITLRLNENDKAVLLSTLETQKTTAGAHTHA